MFQSTNLDRVKVATGITYDVTGSGLAISQVYATIKQVGISQKTYEVERMKAANIVATLGTESTRNLAQAGYFNQGTIILANIQQDSAGLLDTRRQLIVKLATCENDAERKNIEATIEVINKSLGANNLAVGATLNNGAAAQQQIQ
jgi:hypothetical protein